MISWGTIPAQYVKRGKADGAEGRCMCVQEILVHYRRGGNKNERLCKFTSDACPEGRPQVWPSDFLLEI